MIQIQAKLSGKQKKTFSLDIFWIHQSEVALVVGRCLYLNGRAGEQICVKSSHSDRPRRRNLRPDEGPASIGLTGETQGGDWSIMEHVSSQSSV